MVLGLHSDHCALRSGSYCGPFAAFVLAVSVPTSVENAENQEVELGKGIILNNYVLTKAILKC